MNYRVFFINFGWYSANESPSFGGAKKIAKNAGFQSRIEGPDGELVACFCPMSGWTIFNWEIWNKTLYEAA